MTVPKSWTRLVFVVAILLASQRGWAAPSNADDGCLKDPGCNGHYQKAIALFTAGRYETALPEFQAAYESRQMAWLLINIGRTLHRLGRPQEALQNYERFKAAEPHPDPETEARVEKYIAQSRALVEDPIAAASANNATATPDPIPTPAKTETTPIYKKWWFWTAIGGGAALIIGIGVGAGVAASRSSEGGSLPSDVMVYRPDF